MKTIEEAKLYLRQSFNKGSNCPCCNQFVKLYKRKLNSGMAITLIRIYDNSLKNNVTWIHVKDMLRQNKYHNGHDWTLLKEWGLLDEKINTDTAQKSSGLWMITDKGIRFVQGSLEVPSHVHLYNAKCLGFSDTQTNVINALGNKFNYEELMRGFPRYMSPPTQLGFFGD